MVHIKTLVGTAVIAALGGAFTSYSLISPTTTTSGSNNNDSPQGSQIDYAAQRTNTALAETIKQLQQENNRLKKLLAEQHSPEKETPTAAISHTTPVELQQQLQQLEMEKHLRKANDFSDWLLKSQQENPDFNLNQTLALHFDNEVRDPQWADQQENSYRNLFSEAAELAGFALTNSQCKSSQCELTVSIGNLEQSDQLLEKMNRVFANNNKNAVIVAAADTQSGTTKLYVSEDPKSFEFN